MADSVTFQAVTLATPPDATVVLTDETASGHAQIMKLGVSANGSAGVVHADADGLLVNLGTNNDVTVTGAVTVSGSVTANAGTNLNTSALATEATLSSLNGKVTAVDTGAVVVSSSALPTGAATESTLSALNGKVTACNTGAVVIASGTTAVTQGTAANLNATVVGTGTFAVQATQAGTWTVTGAGGTFPVTGTFWQATQPISAASLPLPSGASTLAEQQTQTASLSVLDDWDESDRCKINLIAGQAGVTGGAGAVSAGTQRVTLASDDPAVAGIQALKPALTVTAIQATASGDTTVVSSGTRKLHRVELSNSHASTALTVGIKIASANGGAVFGKRYLPAAGGAAVTVFDGGYIQVTSEVIAVNLSAAGQIEVTAYYE